VSPNKPSKGLIVTQINNEVSKAAQQRKLAEQGNSDAQHNLGNMYRKGQGVPQDYAKAVEWYGKAAEQGYANAQYNLGVMYSNGVGVPPNNILAYAWASLAAMSGDENNVGLRDAAAEQLSSEDLAKAQAEAARLHALIEKKKGK
jgi:uncharacterized protein